MHKHTALSKLISVLFFTEGSSTPQTNKTDNAATTTSVSFEVVTPREKLANNRQALRPTTPFVRAASAPASKWLLPLHCDVRVNVCTFVASENAADNC